MKKKKRQLRIEFIFNKKMNLTTAYIWEGMHLVSTQSYEGELKQGDRAGKSDMLKKEYS